MIWRQWWLALLLGQMCLTLVKAADESDRPVQYELQVFRLDGSFQSKTSLSPEIWKADEAALKKIQASVTLFNDGQFKWGNEELKLNHNGCFWNGKKLTFEEGYREQLPEGKLKMIYSPAVVKPLGKRVRLKIESDTPFQYMRRQDNGSFELKELTLPVGMNLEVRAQQHPKSGFRIENLSIELRSIGSRAELPGVALPVGKPNLRVWQYQLQFNASPRKGYGILVRPEGTTGAMLIRIAISESP